MRKNSRRRLGPVRCVGTKLGGTLCSSQGQKRRPRAQRARNKASSAARGGGGWRGRDVPLDALVKLKMLIGEERNNRVGVVDLVLEAAGGRKQCSAVSAGEFCAQTYVYRWFLRRNVRLRWMCS